MSSDGNDDVRREILAAYHTIEDVLTDVVESNASASRLNGWLVDGSCHVVVEGWWLRITVQNHIPLSISRAVHSSRYDRVFMAEEFRAHVGSELIANASDRARRILGRELRNSPLIPPGAFTPPTATVQLMRAEAILLLNHLPRTPALRPGYNRSGPQLRNVNEREAAAVAAARFNSLSRDEQLQEVFRPTPPPPPPPLARIDWDAAEIWITPHGNFPVAGMADQFLWDTVIWCVRGVEDIFRQNDRCPEHQLLSVVSREWLARRAIFLRMVRELIFRSLTLPPDVVSYIRAYVLQRNSALAAYQPWRDPAAAADQADLRDVLDMPTDYGKELRQIDI